MGSRTRLRLLRPEEWCFQTQTQKVDTIDPRKRMSWLIKHKPTMCSIHDTMEHGPDILAAHNFVVSTKVSYRNVRALRREVIADSGCLWNGDC